MVRNKCVELTTVAAETIEECVNEWVGQGWTLEGIRFVVGEGSRRPQMAFASFIRDAGESTANEPPRAQ